MASNIIPMSPFSPTAKLTFLALPPEMRLEIYEKLISGPLALCWPEPECLSHMCNIQRLSSVGILRTCHQIREEATPLFYRSVYVGFSHKSPDSRLQYTQLSTRANVREAAFEYPWTHPRALNLWLGSSNAFRNLKHCKLFLDRSLPLWPPSFSALVDINAVTLEHELAEAQRKFAVTDCWPVHGLKISLTIYLSWTSRRTDPPSSSMAVRCGLKPTVHDKYYVQFEFDVGSEIRGKSIKELRIIARRAAGSKKAAADLQQLVMQLPMSSHLIQSIYHKAGSWWDD